MSFLEIKNITIGHEKPLISEINLTAQKGELIAVVGLNGAGKSTLLKSIARILSIKNGQIIIDNKEIENYSKTKLSKLVGFSSVQNITASNLTVFDLVSLGRIPHTSLMGNLSKTDKSAINQAIVSTGLSHLANKSITKISDGEKQRAFITRLIAQQTELLIFDEPTAFLDVGGKHKIISLFKQIVKKLHKSIIFSTHDLKIAIKNADKIWLFLGKKIIEGAPEDLIINNTFNQLFSDSDISFDNFTADFNVNTKQVGKIAIQDFLPNNIRHNWTKNALNKIGYKIDNNNITKIKINNSNWEINNKKFNTLYNLLKYIQNDLKN